MATSLAPVQGRHYGAMLALLLVQSTKYQRDKYCMFL